MTLLRELNQILNLSETQKTVLAITKFSATPKQAYASTTGSEKLVYARESLVNMGYITYNNGELFLTQSGDNACTQYNLVDETGQPTEDAKTLMKRNNVDNVIQDQEDGLEDF